MVLNSTVKYRYTSLSTYAIYSGFPIYQAAFIAIPPICLHFFATFPQQKVSARVQWLIQGAYALAALLGLQVPLRLSGIPLGSADAILRLLTSAFFIVGLLLAMAFFTWRWVHASPEVRQRQRLLIIGIAASILPLLLFYALPVMLRRPPLIGYTTSFAFLILFPIAVSYAVRSGELGSIDWFLNRTLVHLLLIGLLTAGYAALFTLLNPFFAHEAGASPLLATLLALLLTLLFNPLQRFLQYWVDRVFYKGWYDYRSVMEQTGEQLVAAGRSEDIVQVLLSNITTTMKLRCACFLSLGEESHPTRQFFHRASQGCPLLAFSDPTFPTDTAFHNTLRNITAPITAERLRHQISISLRSPIERALLGCPHARLWVPAEPPQVQADYAHQGMLIVGSPRGSETFAPEDLAIFQALARQTALISQNIRLLQRIQQREREIAYLYKDLIYAREEERKRIARELHDNIIQNIHVIYRSIKNYHILPPEESRARLAQSAQWLQNTMNDIRSMCNDLRPAVLDVLGLADAIRSHAEQFQHRTGIPVYVAVSGDENLPISEKTEIMLFRIFQETLWNVEKHAQAHMVHVVLQFPPADGRQVLQLEVRDDGIGFTVPSRFDVYIERNAYGLLNMHERAALVGGQVCIHSHPGEGTRIQVVVPLFSVGESPPEA